MNHYCQRCDELTRAWAELDAEARKVCFDQRPYVPHDDEVSVSLYSSARRAFTRLDRHIMTAHLGKRIYDQEPLLALEAI